MHHDLSPKVNDSYLSRRLDEVTIANAICRTQCSLTPAILLFKTGISQTFKGILNGLEILQRHVSVDALHDSLERSNPPKCHPNTRTAVLKDIFSWVEDGAGDSETGFLWLHGPAGAGKSAIAHSVAEMSQKKGQLAAGFFFSRTAAGNQDKSLIATIAYQILQSIPEARSFIETAAMRDPLIFMKSLSSQIRHLIIQPLRHMLAGPHTSSFPRLIVIDGLDECSPAESQTNILMAIHTAFGQESFPFRVLIASRAEPNICDVFDSELADSTHRISLDDKYQPDQDITLYLRGKFSEILRKNRHNRGMSSLPLPWPSEEAIRTLVSKASGQFIYAATVIRYVDIRHQRPDERLKIVLGLPGSQYDKGSNPFTELDKLYQEIFRTVVDISFTSRLLGALLILKTPLPIDYFESLLGLQLGYAELALCNLHSVVRIPNKIDNQEGSDHIGLYHASLGDFLFDAQRAGVYHIEMQSAHATLAESCLRKISELPIPRMSSIRRQQWFLRVRDPDENYAWTNWIHHFLNIFSWNDRVVREFEKVPPIMLLSWLELGYHGLRNEINQFNKLKSWFIGQHANDKSDGLTFDTLCRDILNIHFKKTWSSRLMDRPKYLALSLGILAVVLRRDFISSTALATLFLLDWDEFGRATFLLRPYIDFGTPVVIACEAFADFVSDPERASELNPNTPDIHADLVIRCVECISSHASGVEDKEHQDKRMWHWDPEGAYQYSVVNWKDHLRQASPRRLLNYAYAVNARSGHQPICTHESRCHILCEVEGMARCIESRIIEATIFPHIISPTDIKLLELLKEIIAVKYLDTTLFSRVNIRIQEWSAEYKLAMSRSPVHLGSSTVIGCTCHSGYVSIPAGFSRITSDDHASLVIRYIEYIAAHPIGTGHQEVQGMRQQTLHCSSEGAYQYVLSQWKDHLRHANPRRLLNYAYVINVCSGHQPVCTHETKCHLLCQVNGITRCIESRIIDGEFFPHTLSIADMKLLKLLREIIDVKYLETPLFARVNSRIRSWSADYRLEISRTLVLNASEAAGPSTTRKGVALV